MNWHKKYSEDRTFGERLADKVASTMGSWRFIIIQTVFIFVWIVFNLLAFVYKWDPYPFILLNLLFSTQAAFAAPIIMMSQNRQNEKDRVKAEEDYNTNTQAKLEIEMLIKTLDRLEREKLDKIIEKLYTKEVLEMERLNSEVIKEVAKRFCEINKFSGDFIPDEISFIRGAEWQSRRSFNEEDMHDYAYFCASEEEYLTPIDWFDKFKRGTNE
jgi:uncharacterized membrane protein